MLLQWQGWPQAMACAPQGGKKRPAVGARIIKTQQLLAGIAATFKLLLSLWPAELMEKQQAVWRHCWR